MGNGPYGKDKPLSRLELRTCSESETASISTDSSSPPSIHSCSQISLRAQVQIVRLVGSLSNYYRVISNLKDDDRCIVSLAEYIPTNQRCTLQTISKSSFRHPKRAKTLLFDRLRRLTHPHILKTYEVCQDDRNLYLVSESYEGGELGAYLENQGYLSQALAAKVITQVLGAVLFCHNQGFVLQSLNLSRIVLKWVPEGNDIYVKLVESDFSDLEDNLQRRESAFSAPDAELSDKSDIWSCGVILYYLLSGRNPFQNYSPGQYQSILKYKGFSFPPAIWGHVSSEAIALLLSMLNSRPEERPSVRECLAHPWIRHFKQEMAVPSKAIRTSLHYLQYNSDCRSLQEAIMKFIINRVLKDTELAKRARVFAAIDLDGDGLISRSELLAGYRRVLPEAQAERETDLTMRKLDRDGNGVVDFEEFLLLAFNPKKLLSRQNLKTTFNALDRDGSGRISVQELKHFFRIDSTAGSHSQWKHLLSSVDTRGQGEINFEEFRKLMTQRSDNEDLSC